MTGYFYTVSVEHNVVHFPYMALRGLMPFLQSFHSLTRAYEILYGLLTASLLPDSFSCSEPMPFYGGVCAAHKVVQVYLERKRYLCYSSIFSHAIRVRLKKYTDFLPVSRFSPISARFSPIFAVKSAVLFPVIFVSGERVNMLFDNVRAP